MRVLKEASCPMGKRNWKPLRKLKKWEYVDHRDGKEEKDKKLYNGELGKTKHER
jgi:hypothetical protein